MPGRRARTDADRVALFLLGIRQSSSRLHYAWIIVAVYFAVAVMTAGVRSTPGVLIVPLEDEFGWSRATISFALGINLLLFGAIGPFAAAPQATVLNTYQFIDNVTWTRGTHTLKFGWEGRKYITSQILTSNLRGDYEYSNLQRFLLDQNPDLVSQRAGDAGPYSGNAISTSLFE